MGQSPEGATCNEIGEGVPLLNGPAEFTNIFPIPKQYTIDPKRFSAIGDILFCVRGSTTGRMNWSDRSYAIGRGLASLTHKNGIELNHFLKYLIDYNLDSILKTTNGSTFPNLNSDMLATFKVIVPELPIQQKISLLLSFLDSKIELNQRINTELEQMAKTIYDYWFVQFDFPMSKEYATSIGQPELEGKPYKSSGGRMVWSEELKREVPEGWEVKKIKEISVTGSGGTPLSTKREYYKNGNIPWINSGEVNAPFIIEAKKFISEEGLNNSSAKLFPKGTILMAMYGATAGQVSLSDIEACTNQAVCFIIPKEKKFIEYIKFALHQMYDYLVKLSSGSARDNLSQDKIKDLHILIPSTDQIDSYHQICNIAFKKILSNLKENQKLTELRDWLLPMLMNGQVKVGDGG